MSHRRHTNILPGALHRLLAYIKLPRPLANETRNILCMYTNYGKLFLEELINLHEANEPSTLQKAWFEILPALSRLRQAIWCQSVTVRVGYQNSQKAPTQHNWHQDQHRTSTTSMRLAWIGMRLERMRHNYSSKNIKNELINFIFPQGLKIQVNDLQRVLV